MGKSYKDEMRTIVMSNKKIVLVGALVLFLILFSSSFISAITGSIGNARMILNAKQGDVIEKTILVKNVNDVAIDVALLASGDLAEDIEIIDGNFTLQPNEELKARIKITVSKSGTTESAVNVQFTPVDGQNGLGLSSKIIVIAEESSFWDFLDRDDGSVERRNATALSGNSEGGKGLNLFLIIGLVIVIIALLAFLYKLVFLGFKKDKHSDFGKSKFQKRIDRSS